MPQVISCPECDSKLRIKDELLGTSIRCPSCSTVITTQKPKSSPKKPVVSSVEEEDDEEEDLPAKPVKKRRGQPDEEGPPKWLIKAIIAGTAAILFLVLGGLAFIVFGTNLLTPATKPKPKAPEPTQKDSPATTATPSTTPAPVSPPTTEPAKEKWVRKLIPGTKISVEVPESSGGALGEITTALAELGGGGGSVSGTLSTLGIPKTFIAMIAPDLTMGLEGDIDFIAGVEKEAMDNPGKVMILNRNPVQGRKAILFQRKGGSAQLQLYIVEGKQTILFTAMGVGVSESVPSVKYFFESIRFEK